MDKEFSLDSALQSNNSEMQTELSEDDPQRSDGNENNMNISSADNTRSSRITRDEETRLQKRNRDEADLEGEWHNVIRRNKKINLRDGVPLTVHVNQGNVDLGRTAQHAATPHQVAATSKNAFPKQFALAKLFRQHGITGVLKVRYINPYKLMIQFENDESAIKFINSPDISNLEWRRQSTSEVGLSFGIISDIEPDLSEKDLLNDIKSDVDIASVKRLNRACPDGWTASESVRIGFKGSMIPTHIFLCELRIKVKPYIFPVTQCSRCWRFGHTAKMCPANRPICPKCGERHTNCETQQFSCANCRGDHLALSKKCPTFLKEKRIRELMREFNCTYQKALDIYVPPSPLPDTNPAISEQAENHQSPTPDVPACSINTSEPRATPTDPSVHPSYRDIARKVPDNNVVGKVDGHTYQKNKDNRQKRRDSPLSVPSANIRESVGGKGADLNSVLPETSHQEDYLRERSEEEITCLSDLLERLKNIIFVRNLSFQEKVLACFSSIKSWIMSSIVKILSELPLLKTVFGSANG